MTALISQTTTNIADATVQTTVATYTVATADTYAPIRLLVSGATAGSIITLVYEIVRSSTTYPVTLDTIEMTTANRIMPLPPIQQRVGETVTLKLQSDTADALVVIADLPDVLPLQPATRGTTYTPAPSLSTLETRIPGVIRTADQDADAETAQTTTITNAISASSATGDGQHRATITVQDADEDAVENVRLKIVGTSLTTTTGTSGVRYFDLNDGEYTLRVTPPFGYADVADVTFEVDGADVTVPTITLTRNTITPPSDPTLSTGTLRLLNQHGTPISGAKVRFEVFGQPKFAAQSVIVNKTLSYTTNASGIIEPTLIRSSAFSGAAQYDVIVGSSFDAGGERRFRIAAPIGATFSVELGV